MSIVVFCFLLFLGFYNTHKAPREVSFCFKHTRAKAGKISIKNARGEFIKCCFNVENNLKMVDRLLLEEKKQRKAAYWAELLSRPLDEKLYNPRTDITVWNTWLETTRKLLIRQKFFVLTGDSRLGKTEFVKQSLKGGVFLATCSNAEEPDLRDFEGPPEETTILYDEATPQMVIDHKDLFQAPRHEVCLGHSGTNCYAYKARFWQVRMIIATNDWFGQVDAMPRAKDRDWLQRNSVVYDVKEPLFRSEDGELEPET